MRLVNIGKRLMLVLLWIEVLMLGSPRVFVRFWPIILQCFDAVHETVNSRRPQGILGLQLEDCPRLGNQHTTRTNVLSIVAQDM